MITKIISGGQTGGDIGGLLAGEQLNIPTGGHCPKGWRNELGTDFRLEKFGLICTDSSGYPTRTRLNVLNSDGTVGFGLQGSPGMKLTRNTCKSMNKPYFPVAYYAEMKDIVYDTFRQWLINNNIKVLNVAGNRESTNPGIEQFTMQFLVKAINEN